MGAATILNGVLAIGLVHAQLSVSFSLDTSSEAIPGPGAPYHEVQSGPNIWPWQVYKSSSELPPNLTITSNGEPLAPGYLFFTPSGASATPALKEAGNLIMTSGNELVYGQKASGGETTDFRVQNVGGKQYLTYWEGQSTTALNIGHGYGKVIFLDSTYQKTYEICPDLNINTGVSPAPKCTIDLHEHQVTPRGTILLTVYNTTQADLTSVGGSANGWIDDCLFFEVDIATSKVLFSWSSQSHVPVSSSHLPLGQNGNNQSAPWDYFHMNSIAPLDDDYLVNARHTWTTYLVSGKNGSILWQINGQTGGDFGTLPADGTFRWQHFARPRNVTQNSMVISWFDNHNSQVDNGTEPTKGLALKLSLPPNKSTPPTVVRHVTVANAPIYADSQGSYQIQSLPGGSQNQFMGYGQIPVLREYGPAADGSDLRWEARFGSDSVVQSYRGFKLDWHATPAAWDPSLVLEKPAQGATVGKGYVSWNGATEVQQWNVYTGKDASHLSQIGSVAKKGFETVFNVPSTGCVQVAAVQRSAEVRKSKVVCLN